MAKNWTMKEATEVFVKGDKESIADIGRRFPLLSYLLAGSLSGNVGAIETLLKSLPEHLTCNKVNTVLKGTVNEPEVEAEDEVVEDEQVEEKAEEVESDSEVDLESMTTKQLYQLCIDRGIKVPKYGKTKTFYLEALEGQDGTEETEDEDTTDNEEVEENKYEGMSTPKLFKECKKRGLKVPPKKSASFYIEKLEEDDKAQEADEDDDWGDDDEEVVEKPKKSKADKKPVKKAPAKKVVEEEDDEDDDDDWDI